MPPKDAGFGEVACNSEDRRGDGEELYLHHRTTGEEVKLRELPPESVLGSVK